MGLKIKKKKKEDNDMTIKIPKEKNNLLGENPGKKLLNNKRKIEYSSKSIYSSDENVPTKIKKKSENEKEIVKNQISNPESIYDILPKNKDKFKISNKIIETKSLKADKQYYIFFNKKYDIPRTSDKNYKIKYKLLKDTNWIGMGICDKKVVENNGYDFNPTKQQKEDKKHNIGTYLISTNQISWNCNNLKQCKKFDTMINKANTEIELILNPIECELEFRHKNNLIIKFNDVRCFKSDCFSPCLIFLHNCKVETNFEYPA